MISFRFHVVSITAVFLAIAIGIVVGSTYVDRAIVENLENRIDTVSRNLDARKQANDELERNLDDVRSYVDASADFAVSNRLADAPVLLLAMRGVDAEAAEQMALLARRSGGIVPGVVWVEPKWELGSDEDRAELAAAIGADEDDAVADLQQQAWTAIVRELTTAATPGTTVDATPPVLPLGDLQAGGFLSVDALDDASATLAGLRGTSPRAIVVTGAEQAEELDALVPVVVATPATGGLRTLVADVYVEEPDGPGRGVEASASVPEDLREVVVIIDHADQSEGRVGAILALAAMADGLVGHFGYGSGSDGVLPAWTPP
jgi:hypothetical protein